MQRSHSRHKPNPSSAVASRVPAERAVRRSPRSPQAFGNRPARTSSENDFTASPIACPRSAYCFANDGFDSPLNPRMSCVTSTWPSQSGARSDADHGHSQPPRHRAGQRRRHAFQQDRKRPRVFQRHGIVHQTALFFRQLSPACESRPAHARIAACNPRWPITGIPAATMRSTVSTAAPPPSIFTAVAAPCCIRRPAFRIACPVAQLMAQERHVGHDQRIRRARPHRARMPHHVVHGHRNRGVVTQLHHPQRVAHQQHIHRAANPASRRAIHAA